MNLKLKAPAAPMVSLDQAISSQQGPSPLGRTREAPPLAPAWPFQTAWRQAQAAAERWLHANTFTPAGLPARWRHPAAGYLLVVLVQLLAALFTHLLCVVFPSYQYRGVVEILIVALVALNWGAGPGLFAALVGLVFEEAVVVPIWSGKGQVTLADLIACLPFLAVGIAISVVSSATEQSRRRAVTERAEAQGHELAAMRHLQERMDEFLATASHDLRSPVTVTVAALSFAVRRFERLASGVRAQHPDAADALDGVRRSLGDASQSADRLARLIVLLFDTAQVRAGTLELHPLLCDLAEVVCEPVEALRLSHPQRTIDLRVLAEGPVPVVADADRLGQVVTNYLTNALKYSSEERPVAVRVEVDSQLARVAVTDHGPGLPCSEQQRIWQRFYRAEGVCVQSGSGIGLGLGLHISKTIIERHGGQAGVESAVGRGSTFWFTLPLATTSARAQPN